MLQEREKNQNSMDKKKWFWKKINVASKSKSQ